MTTAPPPVPTPPGRAVRPASGLPWLLALVGGTLLCQLCSAAAAIGLVALVVFGQYLAPFYGYNPAVGSGDAAVSAETAHVIDAYLDAMQAGDAATAYALYSSASQAVISLDDLERLLMGPNAAQFSGYRAVTIEEIYVGGPNGRQQWAEVGGRVIYLGDSLGTYVATLTRESGAWRLSAITLYPPPEKLGPTGAAHGGRDHAR